ncbi:MAG: hypothetical protein V1911_02565 [Candidatus Micrarchaeota archaeon]
MATPSNGSNAAKAKERAEAEEKIKVKKKRLLAEIIRPEVAEQQKKQIQGVIKELREAYPKALEMPGFADSLNNFERVVLNVADKVDLSRQPQIAEKINKHYEKLMNDLRKNQAGQEIYDTFHKGFDKLVVQRRYAELANSEEAMSALDKCIELAKHECFVNNRFPAQSEEFKKAQRDLVEALEKAAKNRVE